MSSYQFDFLNNRMAIEPLISLEKRLITEKSVPPSSRTSLRRLVSGPDIQNQIFAPETILFLIKTLYNTANIPDKVWIRILDFEIRAGVPQGDILEPVLYLLCTNDRQIILSYTIATSDDDTALLDTGDSATGVTTRLQRLGAVNKIVTWSHKLHMHLSETKSVQIILTNKEIILNPIYITL